MDTEPAILYSFVPLHKIEAIIGAVFALVVGVVVLLFVGDGMSESHHRINPLLINCAMTVVSTCEMAFLCVFIVSLARGGSPFAPWFAIKLGHWPIVLRPLVASWWLAHFLVAGALVFWADGLVSGLPFSMIGRALLYLGINFTLVYSANLFALLVVTALGGREGLVHRLWKWRIAFDLTVALAASYVPLASAFR